MITTALALLHLASPAPVEAQSEWPFRIMESAIIVDSTVNGRNVACMFDTGFSGAYVLNENVNVGKATGTMTLQDFVGTLQAKTVPITSLSMGEVKFDTTDMQVVSMPNNNYTASYGTHCDGIMGLEVVAHKVFQINFEKSKFVFYPQSYDISKFAGQPGKHVVKMLPIGNNAIKIPVEAPNGKKLYLSLDTGNGFYTTTHKDSLERIGLWKTGVEPKFTKASWVASGPVKSWSIQLEDMNIYGIPVETSVWDIIDLPSSSAESDGTVGFGFLKHFNITIDMERRLVLLEQFSDDVTSKPVGEVGINAYYNERQQRMEIFNVTPDSPAEKAGIKRGDFLIGLDGEVIENMSPYVLSRKLDGEVGSKVNVSISRGGMLFRYDLERVPMVNKPIQ